MPATTQVYLRWDGVEGHRASYDKTALGKMMKGDTGDFVTKTFAQIQEGLGSLLTVEQLLGGVPPEKLQKLQDDAKEAAKGLNYFGETLGKLKPNKGSDASWAKMTKAYGENTKAVYDGTMKKDAAATTKALTMPRSAPVCSPPAWRGTLTSATSMPSACSLRRMA